MRKSQITKGRGWGREQFQITFKLTLNLGGIRYMSKKNKDGNSNRHPAV